MTLAISGKIPNCHFLNFLKQRYNVFHRPVFLRDSFSVFIYMHPESFKNIWWKHSYKKNKKNILQNFLCPIVPLTGAARAVSLGSVLFSLSPEFIELIKRLTKPKKFVMNHFSTIFAILFLSFYVSSIFCEELSRQEEITGQYSFLCWYRLFLMRSILDNWLPFDLPTHFLHQILTETILLFTKCKISWQ